MLLAEGIREPEGCEASFGGIRGLVDTSFFLVGVVQIWVFRNGMEWEVSVGATDVG